MKSRFHRSSETVLHHRIENGVIQDQPSHEEIGSLVHHLWPRQKRSDVDKAALDVTSPSRCLRNVVQFHLKKQFIRHLGLDGVPNLRESSLGSLLLVCLLCSFRLVQCTTHGSCLLGTQILWHVLGTGRSLA